MSEPKIKYKTFSFHTNLEWADNRAGILRSAGKPEFRVASPPQFKGEEGVWTPEDLFVAAVDVCTMTTFVAIAQRLNLPVQSYISAAEGIAEFIDGSYRLTKVILRPTITIKTAGAVEQTEKALSDAHKGCLISNSIRSEVYIEPTIQTDYENNL